MKTNPKLILESENEPPLWAEVFSFMGKEKRDKILSLIKTNQHKSDAVISSFDRRKQRDDAIRSALVEFYSGYGRHAAVETLHRDLARLESVPDDGRGDRRNRELRRILALNKGAAPSATALRNARGGVRPQ